MQLVSYFDSKTLMQGLRVRNRLRSRARAEHTNKQSYKVITSSPSFSNHELDGLHLSGCLPLIPRGNNLQVDRRYSTNPSFHPTWLYSTRRWFTDYANYNCIVRQRVNVPWLVGRFRTDTCVFCHRPISEERCLTLVTQVGAAHYLRGGVLNRPIVRVVLRISLPIAMKFK